MATEGGFPMRRGAVRFGAIAVTVLFAGMVGANEGTMGDSVPGEGNCGTSPTPAKSPAVTTETDPASGAAEVGIGRSTGAVKGSGDEGGTAAGMPGKGPESGH
jgi:hypothetical protein